ncbi:Translation initiation factor eIF-2B subunit gamma like protein [Verticillium longisporum]|uniref:Translation initiation factor eIF-2B subunit gamma like protein n=1 Tax=Verticillium longisporum TaxID=100787 RepID=A0A8I2Z6X0_VERLO|nr:Translation initiation factor eIF-2B subunit gamma like protein [Verticillium longisporum]
MPHAVSVPSPGLQALILCGPGSSFPTFTSNPDESPKALLPIANRPMVWYALDFCYRTGITDITLVCPASAKGPIEQALNTNPHLTALPLPRPDILAPSDLEQTTGTAEILRLASVREIVKSDFVVLPCDLVCELAGEKLVQAWMVKAASLAEVLGSPSLAGSSRFSGGLGVWYETKTALAVKKEETDFIASTPLPFTATSQQKASLLPHLSNLVYSMPKDSLKDLTEEKSGLPIRHGLLCRHPRIRMLTTHRDAHLYIFPKWILDFIKENERFENIGEDVIGWWAKAGWQAGLGEKLGLGEILREEDTKDAADSVEERTPSPDHQETDEPTPATSSRTRRASNAGSIKSGETAADDKKNAPLVRRVDTAQLLLNVSLQLAKIPSLEETLGQEVSPFAHAKKVAYPEGVKSRTTITRQDSLVGDNVTVEEKVSIKESVVGAGCQTSEGAKLSQCLLMDGVVVGKNCKLTKCILGKRCENLLVEARTEDKDNKLMSSEGLEATEEEMHEVLQDMEDEVMAVNEVAVE